MDDVFDASDQRSVEQERNENKILEKSSARAGAKSTFRKGVAELDAGCRVARVVWSCASLQGKQSPLIQGSENVDFIHPWFCRSDGWRAETTHIT